MAKKQQVKTDSFPVPRDRGEATRFIAEIGELQRSCETIETTMNTALLRVKVFAEESSKPHREQIERLSKGLQAYCETRRTELLKGESKTHKFASGLVNWRRRPAKVTIRGVENVLKALKASKALRQFIRTKEEIDKETMLKKPDIARKVDGVSIGSTGEDFVIKPFSTELEVFVK